MAEAVATGARSVSGTEVQIKEAENADMEDLLSGRRVDNRESGSHGESRLAREKVHRQGL